MSKYVTIIDCFKRIVYEIKNGTNFMWLIKCFLFKLYFHLNFAMSVWEIIMLKTLECQKEVKDCGKTFILNLKDEVQL